MNASTSCRSGPTHGASCAPTRRSSASTAASWSRSSTTAWVVRRAAASRRSRRATRPNDRLPLPSAPVRKRGGMRSKGAIAWLVVGALGALLVCAVGRRGLPRAPVADPDACHDCVGRDIAGGVGDDRTPDGVLDRRWADRNRSGGPRIADAGFAGNRQSRDGSGSQRHREDPRSDGDPRRRDAADRDQWQRLADLDAATGVELNVNGRPIEIPGGITQLVIAPNGTVRGS